MTVVTKPAAHAASNSGSADPAWLRIRQ